MANSYFRFRQFTIHQDRCSMKVCTDSCILGAWTARHTDRCGRLLDIGAGTGLLSLMLAQKQEALIDAIELDRQAAEQAAENIRNSPWKNRIHVINGDIRHQAFDHRFDFIISNPPFFESDLRSPSQKKNQAKHDESLTIEELLLRIKCLLNPDGAFSILLPHHRTDYAESLAAENGFSLQAKLLIRQTPAHDPFRSVLLFGFSKPAPVETHEIIIRGADGKETAALISLMEDYYLPRIVNGSGQHCNENERFYSPA